MKPTTNNFMFDDASILWIDTDYIYQNLKMPLQAFQQLLFTIPSKHRKMINDASGSCHNTVRYMVDIYGASVLVLRTPNSFADQLLSSFIANNYLVHFYRRRQSRSRSRSRSARSRSRSRSRSPSPSPRRRYRQILDGLDKVRHQNDLLISNVNQINLNQSSQFLEISNMITNMRNQNVQFLASLENAKDVILTQLNALINDIKNSLPDFTTDFNNQIQKLLDNITAIQQTLRNELNGTNSILTNLTSSITNINTALNNLLSAIENLIGGDGNTNTGGTGGGLTDTDRQKLDNVVTLVNEIRNILMGTLTKK
ncbi:pp34 [Palpita vitrealis nucleopolyhedrovirus]|uniref:Pp34 n=1 Tax=Palpita vitrealis nucleopolyhedrovirus TaxID=2951960 RepID=A0AAE9RYY3_9ABAC|nr:pp34 [Palpita vitrealis nucleopolyhedrovirus]